MRRAALIVGVLVLAGCASDTMLPSQLDHKLSQVNSAVERGDVEVACARLGEATPLFADWAVSARGERAALGNQLLDQMSSLSSSCNTNLLQGWPPLYQEMRRISTYKRSSWLTVFIYVSMLGVAIAVYLYLRRVRP